MYLLKTFPPKGEGLYPTAWKLTLDRLIINPLTYNLLKPILLFDDQVIQQFIHVLPEQFILFIHVSTPC